MSLRALCSRALGQVVPETPPSGSTLVPTCGSCNQGASTSIETEQSGGSNNDNPTSSSSRSPEGGLTGLEGISLHLSRARHNFSRMINRLSAGLTPEYPIIISDDEDAEGEENPSDTDSDISESILNL